MFAKQEYPIAKKANDVINWLERDLLQTPIQPIAGDKVTVTFQPARDGNRIEVRHILRALTGEYLGEDVAFSFEVEEVTDSDALIIGKYQIDNTDIEKLFYLYLARLGGIFRADFKESAYARLQEIQAQIEKEQGGRMGFTEWRAIEGTGIKRRAFGLTPNDKPEGEAIPTPAARTQKKQRRGLPKRKADLRKWAATYEFYDKHCGMEKMNARAFRIFFETYEGWDKQTVWMPQDDETLQAIIDYGRAGEIPKYDSIE